MDRKADTPFTLGFDIRTGTSMELETTKCRLSNMVGMYYDSRAFQTMLDKDDPLVYEFYELNLPRTDGNLLFGTSITYPGKVGNEYFMTKGHFHEILETAEVYYVLNGEGYMMMETPEGDWKAEKLTPGRALYVPPRWAHRSINTGSEPLVTFFVFRADAGHDYKTIEDKGFRWLMVENSEGKPEVRRNDKW